ncbi:MAG TPA: hypothetical protein VMZ29_05160 [Candidatus Bathyarchaeia archaeon]|nr:hypothetical protein [Candidatus Bathyarchaeia archaeon]
MNENKIIPTINFKIHLILFFITATFWVPVYNLICLLRLNKLARITVSDGVPSIRNKSIGLFFLSLTFIGVFFTIFRRFQLFHNYIEKLDSHLEVNFVDKQKEDQESFKRLNCLKPLPYLGFVITTLLMIGILVTSFTVTIYHLVVPTWGSDVLMILFPIGMSSIFTSIGFCVRSIKEESKWVKAFNAINKDVMDIKNRKELLV